MSSTPNKHSPEQPTVVDIPIQVDTTDQVPTYASSGAAGADVRAAVSSAVTLAPGESTLVPTGIRVAIPVGYEIQVRPRSGLAYKHGVTVVNSPGTIDSDYRGEIGVILINHGKHPFTIEPNMRIAQLVCAPFVQMDFIHEQELSTTARDSGGFGHTGTQ